MFIPRGVGGGGWRGGRKCMEKETRKWKYQLKFRTLKRNPTHPFLVMEEEEMPRMFIIVSVLNQIKENLYLVYYRGLKVLLP
jgi:hypothetical protein